MNNSITNLSKANAYTILENTVRELDALY